MNRQWLRWVPAVAVPAVVAVVAVVAASQAGAAGAAPERSPSEVLTLIGESDVEAFSGTFEQSSDLGLPALPEGAMSGTDNGLADALELLTASHTARVYVDGPSRFRLQVLDRLGERDIVRNGDDVWTYDFAENTATHLTIPQDDGSDGSPVDDGTSPDETGSDDSGSDVAGAAPGQDARTPAELADRILTAVEPSTDVTLGDDTEVAGRTAHRLVLTPRSDQTLVGSVTIAVDTETGLPLAVDVHARGQEPAAFRSAFTQLSLETPDEQRFVFTPPPGATVEERTLDELPEKDADGTGVEGESGSTGDMSPAAPEMEPTVHGTAWETVVEVPAGDGAAVLTDEPPLAASTTSVSGGRLLSTSLLTVLLTDDGRILAGPVTTERLLAVAADR